MDNYNQQEIERLRAEYSRREQLPESDIYSLFNLAALFAYQQKQNHILKLLAKYGLNPLKNINILELGCGNGGILTEFLKYNVDPSRLYGIDVNINSIENAHRYLPHLPIICADGQSLPFSDGCFQLVMQYTAFSSILNPDVRRQMAKEMLRVLDPQKGIIVSYDFWINLVNHNTKGLRPAEIKDIFPRCTFEFHRITLAPPITRRLIKTSWLLCYFLEKLIFLNTHYLVIIRPICETSH